MKFTEIAAPYFDLAMTLDSGQVFHWKKVRKAGVDCWIVAWFRRGLTSCVPKSGRRNPASGMRRTARQFEWRNAKSPSN